MCAWDRKLAQRIYRPPHCLREPTAPEPPAASAKHVIHDPRECKESTRWIPGLTPKEHIDMNIFERQRAWQADQDAIRRADEARRDDKNFRLNLALVVATIVATIIAAIAAVAAWWAALCPPREKAPVINIQPPAVSVIVPTPQASVIAPPPKNATPIKHSGAYAPPKSQN